MRLIPEAAWVQLGVGSIPDAILTRLGDIPGVYLHSGMLTDRACSTSSRVPIPRPAS